MPDVVVVGAGPVGTLIAALLQRRGIETAVYERRTAISTRPRAVGIHPPAVAALRQLGLELHGARQITRGEARDRASILGAMHFDPPVLTLPQHTLQAELDAHVRHLRRGAPVLTVETGSHAARVILAGGSVGARLVIAADGVGSSIRSSLGVTWHRRPGHGRYLMADIDDDGGLGDAAALWFARGGVVESFPLPASRRRWVARAATGSDLARCVAERTGISLPSATAEATSIFVASQHIAERWVHDRVVLLGDAAHELSPIGGQGMNLGILDAVALAPCVERALDGDADALTRWESERRPSARRAVAQAAFNMSVGVPVPGTLQPVKNLLVRGLARGPAARMLARAFTMQQL
ncbi:FAD-dependent oxidoreductase [Paramicrobacterium agarici]|uniref:2-polyprenyl-6-methoxyphenol hydroxylase-like FAD-dependent oxidoreductase n=1 Tax=Paramicrobacterium agarici TaxID=630514 RepID=A0A2A9DSJ9_9MICO|nr:NAD(P)/FAD-dependent oxidoreductase [Microbacterium agarici]PFG29326.1 2-polyprenyl-6-methoxyphenol hydroxylase-like FAD-dependent oxidoreductase [Microbacterium agarici]